MLELRQSCENCNKPLPNESAEAMICTYECTYCSHCVENILHNVCPNCGGGFEKRPTRPKNQLKKHPVRKDLVHHPLDKERFKPVHDKFQDISPRKR